MAFRLTCPSFLQTFNVLTKQKRFNQQLPVEKVNHELTLQKFDPLLPTIRAPLEVDTPRHPIQLTEQDIERAIAIYQEEFKDITCNLTQWVTAYSAPAKTSDLFDLSDWQIRHYRKRRIRLSSLIKEFKLRQKVRMIESQIFNPKRVGILGPDLAVSHFITYRGGKVKFVGSDKWVASDIGLPGRMDAAFKVEKLDASGCDLYYEGLDHLINLKCLEHLDLSNNPGLDDWSCNRLACHFRGSSKLSYLNLTDNQDISAIGIQSLAKLPSLRTLVISGTKAASYEHLDLLILLFQDVNPLIRIEV